MRTAIHMGVQELFEIARCFNHADSNASIPVTHPFRRCTSKIRVGTAATIGTFGVSRNHVQDIIHTGHRHQHYMVVSASLRSEEQYTLRDDALRWPVFTQ